MAGMVPGCSIISRSFGIRARGCSGGFARGTMTVAGAQGVLLQHCQSNSRQLKEGTPPLYPRVGFLKDLVGVKLEKQVGNHLYPSFGALEKTCKCFQLPQITDWCLAAVHGEPQG